MSPSLRLTRLKSMKNDEFIALTPGLLRHHTRAISRHHRQAAPGADASAFQGRLGAQVALLQSPILPAANPAYPQQREFYNLPVDNTHTRLRWGPREGRVQGWSNRRPEGGDLARQAGFRGDAETQTTALNRYSNTTIEYMSSLGTTASTPSAVRVKGRLRFSGCRVALVTPLIRHRTLMSCKGITSRRTVQGPVME